VFLARAYAVAREVFQLTSFWRAVENLDNRVDAQVQLRMLIEGRRLTERSIRALVRDNPSEIHIAATIERFAPGVRLLDEQLDGLLEGSERQELEDRVAELRGTGVPAALARRVAAMPAQPAVFDIVAVVAEGAGDLERATRTYFRLGSRLELNWLRERIVELPRANRWQALARAALREELLGAHRELTREVLEAAPPGSDSDQAIDHWARQNPDGVERSLNTLADIRASRMYDTTTLAVALREVRALIRRAD
jgi:glutamate dehydrogenase